MILVRGNRGWAVPSTGCRSSTVSFKTLPLLNTRTVCHSLSFRFWPAKIVSGPLPAGQSKEPLTHKQARRTRTWQTGWETERRGEGGGGGGGGDQREEREDELSSLTEAEKKTLRWTKLMVRTIIILTCIRSTDQAITWGIQYLNCRSIPSSPSRRSGGEHFSHLIFFFFFITNDIHPQSV